VYSSVIQYLEIIKKSANIYYKLLKIVKVLEMFSAWLKKNDSCNGKFKHF